MRGKTAGLVTGKAAAAGVAAEVGAVASAVVIAVPGAVAAIEEIGATAADTVVTGVRETVDPGTTGVSGGIPTMTVAARAPIGMMMVPEGTMTAANVVHGDPPAATMGAGGGQRRRAGVSVGAAGTSD